MSKQEGKYNIKAVSQMLGIQPGTLRAWERRYQMIAPVRNDSGHRLYSDEHVRILQWLIRKIDQGFTISQAVSLLENNELEVDIESQQEREVDQAILLGDELLDALLHFNEAKSHELINQAFSLFTVDKVVIDILGTILVRIGDLWEHGKITTAHEHFATSLLRSRIGIIMNSFPHNRILPRVIAVCGPGEWHEFGLLIFTLFLRRKGFEVIYLGASIEEKDIDVVLDTVKPKFLFLSCTLRENSPKTLELVDRLTKERPDLNIGLGGFAIDQLSREQKEHYEQSILGYAKADWEQWLAERLNFPL